jgi:hypothetical protein
MLDSQYLNKAALKAINRLGDLMLPQNGEFPSFSELGCVEHIDDVVGYAPAGDIKDLNLVLSGLAYMPDSVLKATISQMKASHNKSYAVAPLLRQMDFGLRGIIHTLYYSGKSGSHYNGKTPVDIIGYSIKRVPLGEEERGGDV